MFNIGTVNVLYKGAKSYNCSELKNNMQGHNKMFS